MIASNRQKIDLSLLRKKVKEEYSSADGVVINDDPMQTPPPLPAPS
jgi:hypothetical protein